MSSGEGSAAPMASRRPPAARGPPPRSPSAIPLPPVWLRSDVPPMPASLNARAMAIVDAALAAPEGLGVVVRHAPSGARLVDCGVQARGGIDAGLLLARAALADLAEVRVAPADALSPWPTVSVSSAAPVAACLAAQYAGWKVSAGKYFAMASGPIRAAIGREDLFDTIGHRERADRAVGVLEAAQLPPDEVCVDLASRAGVAPDRLTLLVARTASPAGTLQIVARSLETALHKLHDLHFDLSRVRAGSGTAPLPPVPVPADDLEAIGRTNDAILYGARVVLEVAGDDAELAVVAGRMVSAASPSHGRPFRALFEEAGGDFYALDPALFAPAAVELVNPLTGMRHRAGEECPAILAASFGPRA